MDDINTNPLAGIPVEVRVSVGRATPTVGQLMELRQDAVLELDRSVNDLVELYVGEKLIARGELEELDGARAGQLAVRLTEVAHQEDLG